MEIKQRDKKTRWPFFGGGGDKSNGEEQATHTWEGYIARLQAAWCNNGDIGAGGRRGKTRNGREGEEVNKSEERRCTNDRKGPRVPFSARFNKWIGRRVSG